MALSFMTRLSDLAPQGMTVDNDALAQHLIFSTYQLTFHEDGALSVVLFGIKNERSQVPIMHCRTG